MRVGPRRAIATPQEERIVWSATNWLPMIKENFGQPGINDYRNPNLAEAMRHLGYAQHFGVGIQIAREALARNGNPPLVFKLDTGPVMAIIRKNGPWN